MYLSAINCHCVAALPTTDVCIQQSHAG